MLKGENPPIYNFVYQKISPFLDDLLKIMPAIVLQKACGSLVLLAEIGNNFDLCKKATETSLKASDEVVNQQTPNEIPVALSAFYELKDEHATALKYVRLGIDSMKFYAPPLYADVLVYRAMVLTDKVEGDKKKSLEIMGKYHPRFTKITPPIQPAVRQTAVEFAEKLANDLGFKDLDTAVASIVGDKADH